MTTLGGEAPSTDARIVKLLGVGVVHAAIDVAENVALVFAHDRQDKLEFHAQDHALAGVEARKDLSGLAARFGISAG